MPLVIYIHGGAWRMGTQYRPPFQPRLFDEGIAVAAVTYRFSHEAIFPAALHDCKTAVRWLRAHAADYQLDPQRFATWGVSAGGHLGALLGVTNSRPEFEGNGPFQGYSSDVCAVCNWCGPMDLKAVCENDDPAGTLALAVRALMGGSTHEHVMLAETASPLTKVTTSAPPFLHVHGAADDLVPAWHATNMHERLMAAGVQSELLLLPDVGHAIEGPAAIQAVRRFFVQQFGLDHFVTPQ
jgi:acetyl esterase/lipase